MYTILQLIVFETTLSIMELTFQKLSINGDLDYLKNLEKDEFLISTKPQEPHWSAPPLPEKIPIQSI